MVESSKAASDVYCPVAGKVTEVNSELEAKPELINEDCYGAGWICKLKITDKKSLDSTDGREEVRGVPQDAVGASDWNAWNAWNPGMSCGT